MLMVYFNKGHYNYYPIITLVWCTSTRDTTIITLSSLYVGGVPQQGTIQLPYLHTWLVYFEISWEVRRAKLSKVII